jgi:hypothetical protein
MTWALALAALGFMLGSISQGFGDVRSRARQGVVGDWVYSDPTRRSGFGLNQSGQAAQVTTVTLTDQGDDDDVIITINGIDVSINSGTGQTLAQVGADLAEAINAEPLVRGQVSASFVTATLTLTGLTPGLAFTVSIASDPDSWLSSVTTTTSAAEADAVPFGRVVINDGVNSGETERLVALADTGEFTAQVITATPSGYVADAEIRVAVYEVRGSERILLADVSETSATDLDTTLDAIVVSLNAQLPANSVLAASTPATATALTFTAEIAGLEIDIDVGADDDGASVPTWAVAYTTGPSVATSLHRAFEGVSLYSASDEAAAVEGEEGEYAANAGVHYAKRGVVWVESDETVTAGGTVYVELTAGATAGRLYAAASSTRVALSKAVARWERDGLTATDSLAAVRLEA